VHGRQCHLHKLPSGIEALAEAGRQNSNVKFRSAVLVFVNFHIPCADTVIFITWGLRHKETRQPPPLACIFDANTVCARIHAAL
jgi:hypothetical protein